MPRSLADVRPPPHPEILRSPESFTRLIWLHIVSTDPGAARFRTALRVTSGAAGALGAFTAIAVRMQAPESLAMFGVIIAMVGQVGITDTREADQRRTWLWLTPAALASAAFGAGIAALPLARDAAFLTFAFATIFVRRFGPRAGAIAMASFMAFFEAVVLRPHPAALPAVALSIGIGVLTGVFVRFVIVPERSSRTLRWTARALTAAAELHVRAGGESPRQQRRLLAAALAMDREVAALAETGALTSKRAHTLRTAILRYQVAAEDGVVSANIPLPELDDRAPVPIVNFHPTAPALFTRQAVQALAGAALALAAGEFLSQDHWYWAVLAAFVVFNRAPTVGHTFTRAMARIGGTMLGVVLGIAIARATWPHTHVELALLLVGLGAAYYFIIVSYLWTLVFFTICLALLYSMMGDFSPNVLYLRLGLTTVGATAGVIAAALILPVRTSPFVARQEALVFDGLADTFGALRDGSAPKVITALRQVDAAVAHLIDGRDALRRSHERWSQPLATTVDCTIRLSERLRRVAIARMT